MASLLDSLLGANPGQDALRAVQPSVQAGFKANGIGQPTGMFGIKGTARNILGVLGDAFLTQAGRDRIFEPQRQLEREAEAMQGFEADPLASIGRLAQVNPTAARDWFDKYMDNVRNGQVANTLVAQRTQAFEDNVINRAAGMLRTVQDQDGLDRMLPIVQRFLDKSGVQLPFDLPTRFDDPAFRGIQGFAISPKDQESLDLRAARDKALGVQFEKRLEQGDRFEAGRNSRAEAHEAAVDAREDKKEDRRDRRLTITEAGKDRRTQTKRQRPNIRIVKDANGRVVVR